MAQSLFRGPVYAVGSLMDGRVEPTDGADFSYQGVGFLDPRFTVNKDTYGFGQTDGFMISGDVVLTDAIGQTTATGVICSSANNTTVGNGTPMSSVTASLGGSGAGVCSIATGVPLAPFGTSTSINVTAIDMGFATGTTTAGNATVSVPDSTQFYIGQNICIGGAGNSGNTLSLLTQVTGLPTSTSITVSPVPSGSLTNAPIASANQYNSAYLADVTGTGAVPPPVTVKPYMVTGFGKFFNPTEALTRNFTVTAANGASGGNIVITGYDIFGVLMHETIAAVNNSTVAGKKAFKYFVSAVPQFSDNHAYSVGIGNLAGYHIRSDKFEYTTNFFNGTQLTTNNGWTAAAAPASGDVRGTINVANASGFNSAFNGTARLVLVVDPSLFAMVYSTPLNTVPMFGQAQT